MFRILKTEPIWKSYIVKLNNPLFTHEQCDDIIKCGMSLQKEEAQVGVGVTSIKNKNKKLRKSKVAWIRHDLIPPAFQKINEALYNVNKNHFGFENPEMHEFAQYTEYDKGSHYNWHTDSEIEFSTQPPVRKISMSILLSDPKEFVGGELEFIQEGKPMKLKKGEAVFFASFIRHRVKPVKKGIRKSLVMWFGGEPFK
jgi:PKHD-type hydroxylase